MDEQQLKGFLEEAYEAGFYGPLDLKEAKVKELLEEAKDAMKLKPNPNPNPKPKEVQMLLKLKDAIWGESDNANGGYWTAMDVADAVEEYDEEYDEFEEYGDEDSVV